MQIIKSKKQKGLLVLSVFILCVTGLTAWWLNHSYNSGSQEQKKSQHQAFNTKLPEATTKDAGKNKLEIYMQAEKDSARLKEQQKKDSLERRWFNPGPPEEDVFANEYTPKYKQERPSHYPRSSIVQNEEKVNNRLKKLYEAINEPTKTDSEKPLQEQAEYADPKYVENITQLEKLLSQVQNSDTNSNQEMKQLQSVLDKMLDIQYPERVQKRLAKDTGKIQHANFIVSTERNSNIHDSLYYRGDENAFWGLSVDESSLTDSKKNGTTILAVIHRNQVVEDNSTIELRLLQDIYISDILIPKGELISGKCELANDRVKVQIFNIAYNNIIYPVSLTVYDIDGLEGVKVLGGSGQDAARGELNQAIQNMQLYSMNPSIASQAASTSMETVKTLLTKRNKKAKASVKANHTLLLQMTKTN